MAVAHTGFFQRLILAHLLGRLVRQLIPESTMPGTNFMNYLNFEPTQSILVA
jgi:hypothetical protein